MFAAGTLSRILKPYTFSSVPFVNFTEINSLGEFQQSSSLLQRCARVMEKTLSYSISSLFMEGL